jgi:hypothetical protein
VVDCEILRWSLDDQATGAVFRTWIDIQGRLDPKLGLSNPNPVQAKQSVKREF